MRMPRRRSTGRKPTSATWSSVTTPPGGEATTSARSSSRLLKPAGARRPIVEVPSTSSPAGKSTLASRIRCKRASSGSSRALSLAGSSSTPTSRSVSPQTSASATPGIRTKRSRSVSSVRSESSSRFIGPETPMSTTGEALTSQPSTRGRDASSGRRLSPSSRRERISSAASSMGIDGLKRRLTRLRPRLDSLDISSMPWAPLTSSSTTSVTCASTTSGAAPDHSIRTESHGISSSGSRSVRRFASDMPPSTPTISVSIAVSTGRRTQKAGRFKRRGPVRLPSQAPWAQRPRPCPTPR